MLAFMRKHQKYFYVVITFVIVISFSFFGTYGALSGNAIHEQVAFTTLGGEAISRSELEEMALFIGSDSEDKKLFGGVWGPNFLNDGVIKKDFLETGLAALLIEAYASDLEVDFRHRFAREQRFKPYEHPEAPFLSSLAAWHYFAPAIPGYLERLKQSKDPLSPEALQTRIDLYLAEKRFPAPYLSQVLAYQERQNKWIEHDEALDRQDMSLFGYHLVEDWFGPRFNRLIAEFIFNAAAIAEEMDYSVSKEEALISLIGNAARSFKENRESGMLGVSSPSEYFDQQLQRMRLDKTKAIKLWQKVLLFRRLFDDVGQAVFVDANVYMAFNRFANEVVTGDLYRLPDALRFSDFRTLQRFETYLDAVAKRTKEEKQSLQLPSSFLSMQEIIKKNPELVRKRYELKVSSASKKALQTKVSVKDTLGWELDQSHWNLLKTQFPELGLQRSGLQKGDSQKGDSIEGRLFAIDQLDPTTRGRLDQFVREQIVNAHPEWLSKALDEAPSKQESIYLSLKGPSSAFVGLERGEELIKLLDRAEIGKEFLPLKQISFDGDTYYQISLVGHSNEAEVLTFAEANRGAILDELFDRTLEVYYVQMRGENPEIYQNSDKSWKPIGTVRDQVAERYFSKVFEAIKGALKARGDKEKYQNLEGEKLAAYRFIALGETLRKQLEKNPKEASILTVAEEELGSSDPFKGQFKWIRSSLNLSRKNQNGLLDAALLFRQPLQTWSQVIIAPNGEAYFAFVRERKAQTGIDGVEGEQIAKARFLLGSDAERSYLKSLLPLLKEKRAISFEFLNASQNSIEPESSS